VPDAEMLQGPLRLRPPEPVGRHVDRAEAVVFDARRSHGWSFLFAVALIEAGNRLARSPPTPFLGGAGGPLCRGPAVTVPPGGGPRRTTATCRCRATPP